MRWVEWRRFLAAFRPHRTRVLLALLLGIIQSAALFPIPLLLRSAIDTAIPDERRGLLVGIGLALGGLAAFSSACSVAARRVDLDLTIGVATDLRRRMFRRLFDLPREHYDRTRTSKLHDLMVNDTHRVAHMNATVIATLVPDLLLMVGISVLLFVLDWRLALVLLAAAPLLIGSSRLVLRYQRPATRESHDAFREFSSQTLLKIDSQDLIRLTAAEDRELAHADSVLDRLRRTYYLSTLILAIHGAVQQAVVAMTGALLLVAGGLIVISTSMTLGELIGFYAAFALLRGPLGRFAQSYGATIEGQQSLGRIYEFLDDPSTRPYSGTGEIDFKGGLTLDEVSFGYAADRPIVEDLTLEVEPGVVTALIGSNGSGKSTVVNLLLGFYRPDKGVVRADGVAYDDIDLRGLRRRIGVVQQEPFLVPDTMLANITFGRDVSQDQLQRALCLSGADRVACDLPDGLETRIGENGKLLSGGQRQRIAIARALVGDPEVLVLDEPTNHLDELAIANLLDQIHSLSTHTAILIISHQRQVREYADRVVGLGFGNGRE